MEEEPVTIGQGEEPLTEFEEATAPPVPAPPTTAPVPRNKTETRERATFYLDPQQAIKLDEMVSDYRRRYGKRINRNTLVRFLIDYCNAQQVVDGFAASGRTRDD